MNEKFIYELQDIAKVRNEDEETLRIVFEQIMQSQQIIEEIYSKISEVSARISLADMPEAKKRQILYRYLAALYSSIIGYSLSFDGAIAVTKAVLDSFEHDKNMAEHEKEKKIDTFSRK